MLISPLHVSNVGSVVRAACCVTVFLIALLASRNANACDCPVNKPESALGRATLIADVKIRRRKKKSYFDYEGTASIVRIWKSASTLKTVISNFKAHNSCGWPPPKLGSTIRIAALGKGPFSPYICYHSITKPENQPMLEAYGRGAHKEEAQ